MEAKEKLYETVRIVFTENIQQINKMFTDETANWGVSSLREWVESYESSRFTQTGERSAIITSEYNMQCVREWLNRYTPIENMEDLN
jgi:hypothetical protein